MIPIYAFKQPDNSKKYIFYLHPSIFKHYLRQWISSCPNNYCISFSQCFDEGTLYPTYEKRENGFYLRTCVDVLLRPVSQLHFPQQVSAEQLYRSILESSGTECSFFPSNQTTDYTLVTTQPRFVEFFVQKYAVERIGYFETKSLRDHDRYEHEMIVKNIFHLIPLPE